jgi:hypothetical protein
MITHDDISKRAKEIWEREGRPEGRDKEHWIQAEAELRNGSMSPSPMANATAHEHEMLHAPGGNGKDEGNRRRTARRGK